MKRFSSNYFQIKILIFIFAIFPVIGQDNPNRFILIEWENNPLAAEYHLQISDSVKFLNIAFQKKTKESILRLEPNPIFKYGRIAAIDQFGIRGEYSEVFQIEQRIVEEKTQAMIDPLPSNYVGFNHLILLDLKEDKGKNWKTHYKINDGIWQIYNDGIQLTKQGPNLIQYYSEDRLGNREPIKSKEYIFDSEAPEVEMIFSNSFEDSNRIIYTNKNSNVIVNAKDIHSGILSIKTYLRTANDFKEFEWNEKIIVPENFSEKLIELKVIATDKIGNIKSYSKFFKHDLTPPSVSIETISGLDNHKRQISISQLNANDSTSGIKLIQYSINNSGLQPYLDPIVLSDPGEYEIKFQAIDNVGNRSVYQYERIFISDPVNQKQSSKNNAK
jgi:hypothetical protein